MSRKEALFEIFKKAAEHKGEPFPYNNWEEWEADLRSRLRLAGQPLSHRQWPCPTIRNFYLLNSKLY